MSIALDAVILLTLLVTTGWGARKGLILTAGKLVSVSIGFLGAWAAAFTFKTQIAQLFFQPWISQMLADSGSGAYNPIEAALEEFTIMGSAAEQSLIAALHDAGLPSFSISADIGHMLQAFTGTGANILDVTALIISERIAFILIFTITFFSLQLIIYLITYSMEGLTSLPLLSGINHMGGGICGLALGAISLSLVLWLVQTFLPAATGPGDILSESTLAGSRLAPYLYRIIEALLW